MKKRLNGRGVKCSEDVVTLECLSTPKLFPAHHDGELVANLMGTTIATVKLLL